MGLSEAPRALTVFPVRSCDARLAFCGPRAGAQAPVQATPGLACEWGLLARGAAACSGAAPLAGPIGVEAPSNAIRHADISTSFGVSLYPIFGGGARVGWLGRMAHGGRMTPPHLFYKRGLNIISW